LRQNKPRIKTGQTYTIKRVSCDKKNTLRLAELGILEDSLITVYGSNSRTYRVKIRDSFFALDTDVFNGLLLESEFHD
jgi:Fe2+ transport system protein FeoA